MAIPNYTYLKPFYPVVSSPSAPPSSAPMSARSSAAIVASKELAAIREEVVEEALDPKWSARSFEPVEEAKEVLIDPSSSEGKVVRIDTTLSSK